MSKFDLNGAVKKKFGDLVHRMRAKRLSGHRPAAARTEKTEPEGDDGDQHALESMLGDSDDAVNQKKKRSEE